MPELRKDPVLDRWVIIAAERAKRPSDFESQECPAPDPQRFCPFCEGNESKTPPEIVAVRKKGSKPNGPGWSIRVVSNKFPVLRIEGDLGKKGIGIYDYMNGIGAHEVIIEGPGHTLSSTPLSDEEFLGIVKIYQDRLRDLSQDTRLHQPMLFKNMGSAAGASLEHTHSQLIVTPIVPRTVKHEMDNARHYFDFRGRCIFCDMIEQEIGTESRIVMTHGNFVCFTPYAARFPFEMWVLPRRHASHFTSLSHADAEEFSFLLRRVLLKLERGLKMPPYNWILHTSPFNVHEVEHYHWHIEIIPRLTKVAGFEWGTGFYVNPVPPEDGAEFLRGIQVE